MGKLVCFSYCNSYIIFSHPLICVKTQIPTPCLLLKNEHNRRTFSYNAFLSSLLLIIIDTEK